MIIIISNISLKFENGKGFLLFSLKKVKEKNSTKINIRLVNEWWDGEQANQEIWQRLDT